MNVEIFLKMPQELVNIRCFGTHQKELKVIAEYDDPIEMPQKVSQVYKKLDKNLNKVYTVKYILRGDIHVYNSEK